MAKPVSGIFNTIVKTVSRSGIGQLQSIAKRETALKEFFNDPVPALEFLQVAATTPRGPKLVASMLAQNIETFLSTWVEYQADIQKRMDIQKATIGVLEALPDEQRIALLSTDRMLQRILDTKSYRRWSESNDRVHDMIMAASPDNFKKIMQAEGAYATLVGTGLFFPHDTAKCENDRVGGYLSYPKTMAKRLDTDFHDVYVELTAKNLDSYRTFIHGVPGTDYLAHWLDKVTAEERVRVLSHQNGGVMKDGGVFKYMLDHARVGTDSTYQLIRKWVENASLTDQQRLAMFGSYVPKYNGKNYEHQIWYIWDQTKHRVNARSDKPTPRAA